MLQALAEAARQKLGDFTAQVMYGCECGARRCVPYHTSQYVLTCSRWANTLHCTALLILQHITACSDAPTLALRLRWSCPAAKLLPPPPIPCLCASSPACRRPQNISNTVLALAKLEFDPGDELLEGLSSEALRKIKSFTPQVLVLERTPYG